MTHRSTARIVWTFVGTAMLSNLLLAPQAMAQDGIVDGAGAVGVHASFGPASERAALPIPAVSRESLASMRAKYIRFGQISKQGPSSVALALQVIDVLAAPSAGEYRRLLKLLPVTIVRTSRNFEGTHTTVEYRINGKLKSRSYAAGSSKAAASDHGDELSSAAHESGMPLDAFGAVRRGPAATTNCSWTDEDGMPQSGACATQQEIDDAWLTIVSLEEGNAPVQAQGEADEAAFMETCGTIIDGQKILCQLEGDNLELASAESADGMAVAGFFGGDGFPGGGDSQFADGTDFMSASNGSSVGAAVGCDVSFRFSDGSSQFAQCYSAAISFGASLANFGLRINKVSLVLGLANPAAGAVGEAVGFAVIGAALIAGAAIALHDCLDPNH